MTSNPIKHPLIGLMGPAGGGKDTAADFIMEHRAVIKRAYAKPLYDMVNAFFSDYGIIPKWHDREWKEATLPEFGFSPRHMLQQLGTGWGRDLMRKDFWLLPMQRAVKLANTFGRGVVIPDVRFDDEVQFILDNGGFLIYIDSPWAEPVKDHVSNQPVWERHPCWQVKNEYGDVAGTQRKLLVVLDHHG